MKKINIYLSSIILAIILVFAPEINFAKQASVVNNQKTKATVQQTIPAIAVKPLALVYNPKVYLNKRVSITATFDKFSSLGLDYKPAFRSSEEYITFLIRRDDVSNDIPLSEMKNFIKRTTAEKFIDIEAGDVVNYEGKVFSNALGDVWIDVDKFKIVSKKNKKLK